MQGSYHQNIQKYTDQRVWWTCLDSEALGCKAKCKCSWVVYWYHQGDSFYRPWHRGANMAKAGEDSGSGVGSIPHDLEGGPEAPNLERSSRQLL